MFRKTLALIFVIGLLAGCLASCAPAPQVKPSTLPSATQESTANAAPKDIVWNADSNLHIVYAAEAESQERLGADSLFNAFLSRMVIRATVSDDSTAAENAIHIGATNAAKADGAQGLRLNDFRIYADQGKIFLQGGSPEATESAVEYFLEQFVKRGLDSLTLPGDLDVTVRYEYPINDTRFNGKDLSDYRVLIPEDSDLFTRYAAQNLIDFIKVNVGLLLPLEEGSQTDACEIVVGMDTPSEPKANDYLLYSDGEDVLMDAEGYMIGAPVGDLIHNYLIAGAADALPQEPSTKTYVPQETKNAILLIGDGMGMEHIEAVKKERIPSFCAEVLPHQTECTTYSVSVTNGSAGYTDSAASGTALSTGTKTINGYVGVDENQKTLTNVRELAQKAGAATAVLTTDDITGATPAAFLAHVNERTLYSEIEKQINELKKKGELDFAEGSLGDFLLDTSAQALHSISAGEKRFFAMIEEGYIDKHSHNNDYNSMLYTMERYDDLIAYVMEFTLCHPDTALLITADHETGGLTHEEDTDEFYFTSREHTNANVKLFMMGSDAEQFTSSVVDNTDIGNYLCDLYQ